jgi:hypothetical protein
MESVVRWDVGVSIDTPCAGFTFSRPSWNQLRIVMYFSLVKGGGPNDLEVLLEDPIAMHWWEEAAHSVTVKWPKPLPSFSMPPWKGMGYPLLRFQQSAWVAQFDGLPYAEGRQHLAFLAMNDVIEVIAKPSATVKWIPHHRVSRSVVPERSGT